MVTKWLEKDQWQSSIYTGSPSSRLEKKQTSNSWKRHVLNALAFSELVQPIKISKHKSGAYVSCGLRINPLFARLR